jgi:Ca2+-binding EF-hand superfamily protein
MRYLIGLLAAVVLFGATTAQAAKPKPRPKAKAPRTPEQRFTKFDANKDGKLTLEEFVGRRTGDEKQKAENQFRKRDKDADGAVSADEFKATIKKKKNKDK